MIINESAGSGGDCHAWYFRRLKLGPLVGKRTWGGLVGIGGYPPLIDGGCVTAPHSAFWFPNGKWDVENHGVPPDIEVELDPKAVAPGQGPAAGEGGRGRAGGAEEEPAAEVPKRPAYPNYHAGRRYGTVRRGLRGEEPAA